MQDLTNTPLGRPLAFFASGNRAYAAVPKLTEAYSLAHAVFFAPRLGRADTTVLRGKILDSRKVHIGMSQVERTRNRPLRRLDRFREDERAAISVPDSLPILFSRRINIRA